LVFALLIDVSQEVSNSQAVFDAGNIDPGSRPAGGDGHWERVKPKTPHQDLLGCGVINDRTEMQLPVGKNERVLPDAQKGALDRKLNARGKTRSQAMAEK
jgi:hypothetical protein